MLKTVYKHRRIDFSSLLIQQTEDIPEPHDIPVGQDVYFEILELQPIRLSLSFMRTDRVSGENK